MSDDHRRPEGLDSDRLVPGQLIADRYRVGEVVGRGAMGVVYAGEHVRVGRRVAIKVLTRMWSNEASVRQRFEAEARAASAAGHPNVIQVFDVGELPDRRLYSVMEFVDGRDLYSLLWAEGPLELARACRLIREVAFGVRAAHAHGVIHRDLKLENVMVQSLREGEVVKVLDFGIAAGVTTTKRATVAGVALGTPEYMAPEQVDAQPPTVQFDIYALGVMLFELVSKRLPIEDENPLRLMALKGHEGAPRVAEFRPEVPPALDELIADCLDIDPDRRPGSCEAFIDRLTEILAALESAPPIRTTLVADPRTPPPRPSRLTRAYVEREASLHPAASVRVAGRSTEFAAPRRGPARPPMIVWLAGLVVVAVIGLGLFAYFGQRGELEPVATIEAEIPEPQLQPRPQPQPQPSPIPTAAPTPIEVAPDLPQPEHELDGSARPPAQPARDPSKTSRCKKLRAEALDGRRTHDWQAVLDAARKRKCWASPGQRKKLETQAYMELGRFADCLRTGKHLNDTEAKKWVTLCSKRLAE